MSFSPERLLDIVGGFGRPSRYWVSYSGGLDSSVLLHALAAVKDRLPAPLHAIHFDHGLQTRSADWSAHCRTECERLGVPLQEVRLNLRPLPGASVEAEARDARRNGLLSAMGEGDLVLNAHHRDDQAETLLLQLLRGGGLSGLAAMPVVTNFGSGRMARPLLDFTRADLQVYAEAEQLNWIEDPTNAETGFDRNYLRHNVLPIIAERWPGYAKTLSRSARHCAEAQHLIDHLAEDDLNQVRGSKVGTLSVSALLKLEPPLCRALLRRWIKECGFRVPNSRKLDRIIQDVLCAAPDRSPLLEWAGAQVRRYRDNLYLMAPLPPVPDSAPLEWDGKEPLELPNGLGTLTLKSESEGPLQVRFRVAGEHCREPGAEHRKSLKNLFQEKGVPAWLRPYFPMVYENGELTAIPGLYETDRPIRWRGDFSHELSVQGVAMREKSSMD